MPGTWFGIETARRGMKVHQSALDITGHNLANASTPGYSRQEAVIGATDPYTNPSLDSAATPGQYGTGVAVESIRRIRDEYLDNNVRLSITDSAYWEDQVSFLQRAEASFAEPAAEGIGSRIVDFFKAWMDLNNTPQDPGIKAAVVQLGDELASLMSNTYAQLKSVEESIAVIDSGNVTKGAMVVQVAEINNILESVKDLTASIKKIYSAGQQPNDLLDRRDALLEELSRYGPVTVDFEFAAGKPTGGLEIKLFDTVVFRDRNDTPPAVLETVSLQEQGGNIELVLGGSGTTVDLTSEVASGARGGSLLGLEKARQELSDFQNMLDSLAANLNAEMGDVMAAPSSGSFFTGSIKNGDFRVNPALAGDPTLLDGTKAVDVANKRDDAIAGLDGCTFEEYYSLLVTRVGGSARTTDGMAANQSAINKQIVALRDSVSGVSVDEELTRMLQFQYGFQASARMISVLDEMLDTVISRLF